MGTKIEKTDKEQCGAVLVFKPDVSLAEAEFVLAKLFEAGVLESVPTLSTFDPEDGGPVWYIP